MRRLQQCCGIAILVLVSVAAGPASAQSPDAPARLLLWGPSSRANAEALRRLHAAVDPARRPPEPVGGQAGLSFLLQDPGERAVSVTASPAPSLSWPRRRTLLKAADAVAFVPAGEERLTRRSLERLQALLSEGGAGTPTILLARAAADCALAPAVECLAPGDAGPLAVVDWARRVAARPTETEEEEVEAEELLELAPLRYPDPTRPSSAAAKRRLAAARQAVDASPLANRPVKEVLLPTVWLLPQPAQRDLVPGASRFGGSPDLPEDVEWPRHQGRPLTFLAQLRLEDVRSFDASGLLPGDGWLAVFYDAQEQPWDAGGARGGAKVLYFDGPAQRLRRTSSPAGEDGAARSSPLHLRPGYTLPTEVPLAVRTDPGMDEGEVDSELFDQWSALREAVSLERFSRPARHQLLGHPGTIQGEMRLELATPEVGPEDWILLLQLDSDQVGPLNWNWVDAGRLYFWIPRDDLARKDFSRVRCILQAY